MNVYGVKMKDETALIILGVGVVLAYWAAKKTADAVGDAIDGVENAVGSVVEKINPFSNKNIIYSGVNEIGAVITQNDDFSLGVWLYDQLHPNKAEKGGAVRLPSSSGVTGSW